MRHSEGMLWETEIGNPSAPYGASPTGGPTDERFGLCESR